MIIDTHMHIGKEALLSEDIVDFLKKKNLWKSMSAKLTPEGVIEALDEGGIDLGVVFPLTFMPPDGQWQKMNDMTSDYVQQYPDRLVGCAIINPQDITASLKELERAFDDLHLKGVKLHPSMQDCFANNTNLFPLFSYCQEKRSPILFHSGASVPSHPDKYSQPMLLDDVAVEFPDLKIIVAHAGRPFYQEAALLLRKHPNVYVDICANKGRTGGTALLEMALTFIKIYADGLKKTLFGSDFPVFSPTETLQDLRDLKEFSKPESLGGTLISDDELEGMLGNNAASLFELNL